MPLRSRCTECATWPEQSPPTDPSVYLQEYHRLDIALDSTPYNGATTSCEAPWMGVPVISLGGDRFCGRMGLSLLENLGFPEMAARSAEEFARVAASLAGDLPQLESLRRDLRARMAASDICDGPRAARALEAAYRRMWTGWAAG